MNSYLGEKSDPPQPLQGQRAINRVIAKTIATPLALVLTPLYTAVVIPAILRAVSSANAPFRMAVNQSIPDDVFAMNGSDTWSPMAEDGLAAPAHPDMQPLTIALSALFGVPLILGYVSRNQFIAPAIEKGIAYLEALCGSRDTTHGSANEPTFGSRRVSRSESIEVSQPGSSDSD